MAKALIIAEHRGGQLKKSSFELVHFFSSKGMEAHVAVLGEGIAKFSDELAHYGAKQIHLVEHSSLSYYSAEAYSQALKNLVLALKPDFIIAAHTPTGRDFMPHLAFHLDVGLASDCVALQIDDDKITARRPVYAGKATAEIEFLGAGIQMFTIRPNALGSPKADEAKKAEKTNFTVDLTDLKSKTLETLKGSMKRPDVTEAPIVVSGGRSLKTSENFKIIEELADVLGAAVGASRAAVDEGLRPHRDQVGQTGKVVSPTLYIACGISGAIQHLAGMRTSKFIVAINTDPEAPIFQLADYGIVADLFIFVPLLTQEAKKVREH